MTAPINQTWHAKEKGLADYFIVDGKGGVVLRAQEGRIARLVAKAPEMARMLLELAGTTEDPYCNGCGDLKRGMQHHPQCSLWGLLMEAGVIDGAAVLHVVK